MGRSRFIRKIAGVDAPVILRGELCRVQGSGGKGGRRAEDSAGLQPVFSREKARTIPSDAALPPEEVPRTHTRSGPMPQVSALALRKRMADLTSLGNDGETERFVLYIGAVLCYIAGKSLRLIREGTGMRRNGPVCRRRDVFAQPA